jgi:hypothetical protein
VSASWVAAAVRARGLFHHRLGPDAIRELESASALADAVAALADSPYGRYVRRGMTLEQAERAVKATLLWHLRVLAGWGPALSATSLRLLAGPFEIENIEDLLLRFAGARIEPPFELGSLALSWPRLSTAASPGELRQRLTVSTWGDPGGEDLGTVRLGLRLALAAQVADGIPALGRLAAGQARLIVARANAAGVAMDAKALELARRLLGPEGPSGPDTSLPGMAPVELHGDETSGAASDRSPSPAQVAVGRSWDRLWRAEAAWWSQAEATGSRLAAASNPSESMVVGVVVLLAVDAWRTRGALQAVAAQPAPQELVDAMA